MTPTHTPRSGRAPAAWLPALLVVLLSMTAFATACSSKTQAPAGDDTPVTEATGDAGSTSDDGSTVGMIESGQATAFPTIAEPTAAPTSEGETRATNIEDAASKVPFTVLEPSVLPASAHRDLVHLIAQTSADQKNLPAVRMVYSLDNGSIAILESPATGEAAEGDAVTIGSASGWRLSLEPLVLVWEQDGVRFEQRSTGIDEATAMAAAESMGPLGSWAGPAPMPAEPEPEELGAPTEAAPTEAGPTATASSNA